MALIEWGAQYELGIEPIDKDHQILVKHINDLQVAMLFGKGKSVLDTLIMEILEYAQMHFATEENLMTQISYPHFAAHKAEHEAFLAQIKEFRQQLNDGMPSVCIDVLNYLRDWLKKHLQESDGELAKCLREHKQ